MRCAKAELLFLRNPRNSVIEWTPTFDMLTTARNMRLTANNLTVNRRRGKDASNWQLGVSRLADRVVRSGLGICSDRRLGARGLGAQLSRLRHPCARRPRPLVRPRKRRRDQDRRPVYEHCLRHLYDDW